jgi:D-arabinose 1-dehydrogenase-like Zn-dependent alcohol dehydrogenase
LDAEAGTDTTVLYTLTMPATTNAFTSQTHIDAAVTAIIAAADATVFTALRAAKVLISVVGTGGTGVALFYYSEAGTDGIVATELQLIGVLTGSAQLDATALQ